MVNYYRTGQVNTAYVPVLHISARVWRIYCSTLGVLTPAPPTTCGEEAAQKPSSGTAEASLAHGCFWKTSW